MIYFSVLARLVSGLYQAPVWLGTDSHRHRRSQGTPLHLDSGCNTAVNFHNVHVFVLILLLCWGTSIILIMLLSMLYFSAIYLQASYITIMMIARNLCWCWWCGVMILQSSHTDRMLIRKTGTRGSVHPTPINPATLTLHLYTALCGHTCLVTRGVSDILSRYLSMACFLTAGSCLLLCQAQILIWAKDSRIWIELK